MEKYEIRETDIALLRDAGVSEDDIADDSKIREK